MTDFELIVLASGLLFLNCGFFALYYEVNIKEWKGRVK